MLLKDHIPGDDGELKDLILRISEMGKRIREGFISNQGVSDTENIYGETQVEMDKWADGILVEGLRHLPYMASIVSEERDDIVECSPGGSLSVCFDPLDGSSLMGVNLTVGTIVGIYRSRSHLRPGSEMIGAMYILYGPLTTLVYSVGNGVHEFALDARGSYVLQRENMRIGDGHIYAPGALRKDWLPYHRQFIERLESEGYKLRFCGAFVADVHQIIIKGGVFTYPAFGNKPSGKLRLLFEANPMGYIVTNAGGAVSDGNGDILSIQPERLDQRVPVYIGGKREIGIIEDEKRKEDEG